MQLETGCGSQKPRICSEVLPMFRSKLWFPLRCQRASATTATLDRQITILRIWDSIRLGSAQCFCLETNRGNPDLLCWTFHTIRPSQPPFFHLIFGTPSTLALERSLWHRHWPAFLICSVEPTLMLAFLSWRICIFSGVMKIGRPPISLE